MSSAARPRWSRTGSRTARGSGGWPVTAPPSPRTPRALDRLDLEPLVDFGLRLGEGTGALVALPILAAAAATLAEMATFDEAGVSDRDPAPEPDA